MKKIVTLIAAVLISVSAAFAQQGKSAIGVNFIAAPCLEDGADLTNMGIGVKYQYGITDNIRLEAAFDYLFEDKNISQLDVVVNAQYVFNLSDKFAMYPIVGVGYARPEFKWEGYSANWNRFLVNAGLGAEYNFSENFGAFVEVKYQYVKDFCKLPIAIGVAYKF